MLPSLAANIHGWWRRLHDSLSARIESATGHQSDPLNAIERPWRRRWDHLPRRSPGAGMTRADERLAHERAREVARATLGDELWQTLQRQGYLDLPSRRRPGLTYRLRVGRRIEALCAPGVRSPWPYRWLCINPAYPLPEEEFFAQLYLYVRDREDIILKVAAPQPWDQSLGRTF